MKKVILSLAIIATISFTSCKNEAKQNVEKTTINKGIANADVSFGVRGNCGMCKQTIEKAANALDGVINANWNVNKKKIDVSFDDTKTNAMAIHNAVAASGYDTEKISGSEDAYKGLPACCKYEHNMDMNQSGEETAEGHANHN